eukprot:s7293_g3.t1
MNVGNDCVHIIQLQGLRSERYGYCNISVRGRVLTTPFDSAQPPVVPGRRTSCFVFLRGLTRRLSTE